MRIFSLKEATKSWIWVALFSIVIFLSVPVARNIQSFVTKNLGKKFFIYFVLAFLILAFSLLLYVLIVKLKVRSASSYVWLIIITSLYIYFTLKLQKNPPEALHFLEYGILGFLLFRALKHNIKDKSIYITATLFCLLIGTMDEIIQWIAPRRFWDFQDVGLNVLSGGLMLLATWTVIQPRHISEKFGVKSLKFFSLTFVACLVILGLCISNNPQRVASYTEQIPWLSFLKTEEPMSEFGFKHKDASIGVFYSRFSLKSLNDLDWQKNEEYSQILNNSKDVDYELFISNYNPITHPFIHEIRVHIFRRDTYFKKGRSSSILDEKKEFYFIAYKENLILQKYFARTFEKSVHFWERNKINEAETLINKHRFYRSPVSAHLFTSFSEKTTWIVIFFIIAVLIGINVIFTFKEKLKIQ